VLAGDDRLSLVAGVDDLEVVARLCVDGDQGMEVVASTVAARHA
jgi:hypothetical protein